MFVWEGGVEPEISRKYRRGLSMCRVAMPYGILLLLLLVG